MIPELFGILEGAAASHPDAPAVADGGRAFTYPEIRRRAAGLACHLAARGIGRGDRVSILAPNSEPFLTTYFAAAGLGAVLNPLNHRLAAPELTAILGDSGSRWLLVAEGFREKGERALARGTAVEGVTLIGGADDGFEAAAATPSGSFRPAPAGPDDLVHLYYTSGTTGQPKGVMLTRRNVAVHAEWAVRELGLGPADVWGHVAPMFHLADAWAVFAVTLAGGRHAMVPVFEPEAALRAVARERISATNLVPTMLNLMLKHPRAAEFDLSSLRLLLTGGAPIAPDLVRLAVATCRCEYAQTYGMTETSPYLTVSLLDERHRALSPEERLRRMARTGRPFGGVELRVVDRDGRDVRPDDVEVGEIVVRGPTVSPGYWNRPEETAAAFRGGWLHTGDLARIDAEGSVDIVDRAKDMILCGGENVYSIEVENVLYRHPAVLEAAVVGMPDETFGEAVLAFVSLRPGLSADAEDLRAFCRESLAGYKVPKRVTFLESLPRTGSGKLDKRALRR